MTFLLQNELFQLKCHIISLKLIIYMTFPQNHHPAHPKNLQYQNYPYLKLHFPSASIPLPHFMFYSPNN